MPLTPIYDILLIHIGVYLLLFWPTVGYYVYSDSRKQGINHTKSRGFLLGFLGIIGLLIHIGAMRDRVEQGHKE